MISLDNLKTTLNAIKYLLTDYPKKKDIPTKLPNPNPLTFTGAVTGNYDGSEPLTVEIPSGGGGGGQFIVNVYNTNIAGTKFAADKTYDEISAAIESGMCVVIHKKENINAAIYQVFYHNDTGNGFYKFCHITFGKKIEVHNIGIRMVDGKMVIDIRSKEIQVVTS